VPLALKGVLHEHKVDGAHSAMIEDALQQACALSGDLLTRLMVILSGLELDAARIRANLDLTGSLISSERVMLALGAQIGRQQAMSWTTRPLAPPTPSASPCPRPCCAISALLSTWTPASSPSSSTRPTRSA
jgi:adenylosuccinate lyase